MTTPIRAKVKEVIQRNYNVKSIRLEPEVTGDFKAGQFLCVWLKDGDEYKRYLSISSSPTEKGYLEITKKISQSVFSQTLDAVKPGDMLKVQYPMGKFTLDESFPKVAFLSGGIGITPIRSMCKYALDKGLATDIILLYANRTPRDIVFGEDFTQMQEQSARIRVFHVLCEAESNFHCIRGMINSEIVKTQIPDFALRKFFLCGPPGMVESMRKMLAQELLVKRENIITENFQGY